MRKSYLLFGSFCGLAVVSAIGGAYFFTPHGAENGRRAESSPPPGRLEIEVGSEGMVDNADFFRKGICVKYNGLISDAVFSLSDCNEFAVNNFYPASAQEIGFDGDRFRVEEVTPEKIILTYLQKQK